VIILSFLYVELLEMVMMFYSYANRVHRITVNLLRFIGWLRYPCQTLSVLWQQFSKKENRNTGTIDCKGAVSACNHYVFILSSGATVEVAPIPPSKAHFPARYRLHDVALKKWPIFRFRFGGFAV